MAEMYVPRSLVWHNDELVERDAELDRLDDLLADPDNLVWFDLVNPDEKSLVALAEELQFDLHSVEDALAPGERPKARRQDHHAFVQAYATALGTAQGFDSRLRVERVSAFLVSNGLVTVRGELFPMEQVIERWLEDPMLVKGGSFGLLHGLLDVLIDGHFDTLQVLDDQMEELEDELFAHATVSTNDARAVYRLRRELVEVRRVVTPMRDVVNTLVRYGVETEWEQNMRFYYDDLADHVARAGEWTDSLRDMVATIFETNLQLADTRMNSVMKKLSGWAAIIAVPTLVTGWFGMNVPYWGFDEQSGFIAAIVITIVSVSVLYALFKKYDWL